MPSTRRYRQLRAAVLAMKPPVCGWCGGWIDRTLSGRHPLGPSVDHVIPRAQGGPDTIANLQPMHLRCNIQRGNRPLPLRTSRDW